MKNTIIMLVIIARAGICGCGRQTKKLINEIDLRFRHTPANNNRPD